MLEYIQTGRPTLKSWTQFGQQLAALHQKHQAYFGWRRDNVIGSTPQPNPRYESWSDFFREHRLEHQLSLCRKNGFELKGADALLYKLSLLFEDYSPQPSLLHGDLWSGNAVFDEKGEPFIFDPCSYYGDRETDLAFTEFFGGFPSQFYQAYHEAFPIHPGYEHRKALYNLYHCLNHFNIFGGSYASQAQTMTDQLLSKIL